MPIRAKLYHALNPVGKLSRLSLSIVALIFVSTAVAILETEETVSGPYNAEVRILELIFGLLFAAEYIARIWCAPEGGETRMRYALRPATILDLIVVIATLLPFVTPTVMVLRLVRVLRMLRLAKIGRYSKAFE
ncbi:ion transporter [Qipengyuania thermophila]|uniref:ion transporter n=1 Tax=Qipengyuania thermophila TaxID=2509361 RepID=UPI0013EC5651|nr:ion transporter [Qipengyuania thermophila]